MHVYIHIPFCRQICPYCDFCKVFYQSSLVDGYLKTLKEEIEKKYHQEVCSSIYIGGGTPSHLSYSELEYLLESLKIFQKTNDCEYTIECNLEDLCEEKLFLFRRYGINRISLGIQTSIPKLQKIIQRVLPKETIKEKILLLQSHGFSNINIDLMYALPKETIKELEEDLKFFLSLNVPHISTYSLQLEPHTKFYLAGERGLCEEMDAKMYQIICNTLRKNHYIHYEISNFAKDGFASKHNLGYWNNEEYYGFGAGAAFYMKNRRGIHTKSVYRYIENMEITSEEILTEEDKMDYFLLLGLRKKEGISKQEFQDTFHVSLEKTYDFSYLLKEGILKESGDSIYLPESYFYVMNRILSKLLSSRKNS